MSYATALEGLEDLIEPSASDDPVTHEELDTEAQDLTDTGSEIESSDDDNERFANAAAALESMYQSALPLAGRSSHSENRLLTTAVCAVASARGFSVGPTFAMESIEDESPESRGQKLIRKIKEYALHVWSILVDSYDRVVEWLSQFFQKVTNLAGRLRKKSESLLAQHKKVQHKLKQGAQNALKGRVANVLGVTEGTPQSALKNLAKLVNDLLSASQGKYFDSLFSAIDKLDKNESGDKELDTFVSKVKATYDPIFPYEADDAKIEKAAGVELASSEILPGNDRAYVALPKDAPGLQYFRFTIATDAKYGAHDGGAGLTVLSHGDISGVLETVIDIAKSYEKMSEVERHLKDIKTKLVKARDVIKRSLEKSNKTIEDSDVEIEKFASTFRSMVFRGVLTFIPRATASIHQKTMSYSLNKCKSALYWVDFSLSQYEPSV